MQHDLNTRILERLAKLPPEEFLGLMRFFNIPLMVDEKTPRAFDEMFADFLAALDTLSRRQKKTLLQLITR